MRRLWCMIFGHVQRWSVDDADDFCRRCGASLTVPTNTEPWILEAARELAMDSSHIPCIAQIIAKHAPQKHNKKKARR